MDKTFLVKVKEINDDVIAGLLEFGSIDSILDNLNICIMTADENSENKIKRSCGVTKVEVDEKLGTICN
jgi:hypothetical protein